MEGLKVPDQDGLHWRHGTPCLTQKDGIIYESWVSLAFSLTSFLKDHYPTTVSQHRTGVKGKNPGSGSSARLCPVTHPSIPVKEIRDREKQRRCNQCGYTGKNNKGTQKCQNYLRSTNMNFRFICLYKDFLFLFMCVCLSVCTCE